MMIDVDALQQNIKKNIVEKAYVFYGDEQLIKEGVQLIINKVLDKNFMDLNFQKFNANSLENFEGVINACETLPFMSDKRVVIVSEASFLRDNAGENNKLSNEKAFKELSNYLNNVPEYCVVIFTEEYKNKREKMTNGRRIKSLEKKCCIVNAEKMKKQQLENKIKSFFEARNKDIGKVELRIFSSMMDENNLSIIQNEVEKLCCYAYDREITKEDIKELFMKHNEDDIFDLINPISEKKVKDSLIVLNELLHKGEKIPHILYMMEKKFRELLKLKLALDNKRSKEEIMKEFGIRHPYAYDILLKQSKKFSERQLKNAINYCLNTEQKLKSLTVDEKVEMELLIINAITR